jgi:hypothetical protein
MKQLRVASVQSTATHQADVSMGNVSYDPLSASTSEYDSDPPSAYRWGHYMRRDIFSIQRRTPHSTCIPFRRMSQAACKWMG